MCTDSSCTFYVWVCEMTDKDKTVVNLLECLQLAVSDMGQKPSMTTAPSESPPQEVYIKFLEIDGRRSSLGHQKKCIEFFLSITLGSFCITLGNLLFTYLCVHVRVRLSLSGWSLTLVHSYIIPKPTIRTLQQVHNAVASLNTDTNPWNHITTNLIQPY